jgi:hypothetical protein
MDIIYQFLKLKKDGSALALAKLGALPKLAGQLRNIF